MDFKKTRWMNVAGAAAWALVGVALFLNKVGEQSIGVLATILAMYAVLVSVPALTARALSSSGTLSLARAMKRANWALIVLWAVSVAITVIVMPRGLGQSLLGVVAFVIPEAINIRALNRLLAAPPKPAELAFPPIEA